MDLLPAEEKPKRNKKKIAEVLFHGSAFYILVIFLFAGVFFAFSVYSGEKNSKVEIGGAENIGQGEEIVVYFSSNMLKASVEEGMKIVPELEVETKWKSEKEFVIIPTEQVDPDQEFRLTFEKARTTWFISKKDFSATLSAPKTPQVKSISPSDGETEVEYEERILIDFEKPLANVFLLEVEINPMTGFDHALNDARTQLVIVPENQLSKGVQYEVKFTVNHRQQKDFSESIHQSTFTTKIPPQVVFNLDQNGQPIRTEERKEDVAPQIKEGKYIHIDISSQSLFIFEDGEEKGAFKVSTGLRGMDTPTGSHQVIAKARRPWSAKYKLYMPWFIQFTYDGHGIHELPEWPGGIKEGANHLGIPVSHGCVRLGIGPAKVVYDFAEKGVPVIIQL